jgi:hypothetical protein
MNSKFLSGILVIALSVAISMPAEAQRPAIGPAPPGKPIIGTGTIVGVIAAAAAFVVVSTILVIHYSKKRSVTGCVAAGANGMIVTKEGSNRTYLLAGNTVGIKPGDRMKLHGRKARSSGPEKALVWDTEKVTRDYGVCKVAGAS